MISCFMVLRNGVTLGYPFVESITSALPICDEFIVSEGYSNDNTYDVLLRYFGSNEKVKIFRDKWDTKSIKGSAIRNALNRARERCKYDYIMEVDANEVVPEVDIEFIKSIPTMYPEKELFSFPYYQILGRKILFTEEFRFRMGKNKKSIRVLWDGYTLGYKLTLTTLFERGTPRRILNRALTVILEDRIAGGYIPEQSIYLPRPIFRYYSIFPENFSKKMESKLFHQQEKENDYRKLLESDLWENYKTSRDFDEFWEKVYELNIGLIKQGGRLNKEFREKRIIELQEHPAIIQKLFDQEKYDP